MKHIMFIICWLVIGVISAFDLSLVVKYYEDINELNPMGRFILEFCGLHGLVFYKMSGTITALGLLALLYLFDKKHGLIVAVSLTIFQMGLLFFIFAG